MIEMLAFVVVEGELKMMSIRQDFREYMRDGRCAVLTGSIRDVAGRSGYGGRVAYQVELLGSEGAADMQLTRSVGS